MAPRTVLEKDGKTQARTGWRGPREEGRFGGSKGFNNGVGGRGEELEPESQVRISGQTSEAQTELWR